MQWGVAMQKLDASEKVTSVYLYFPWYPDELPGKNTSPYDHLDIHTTLS